MSKFLNWIRRILCKELPLWAYGVECDICQMTFISPEAHREHARKQRTVKQHQGKIPHLNK